MSIGANPTTDHRPRLRGRQIFALSFVIAFLAMAVWSVAAPLFSGPDEPDQVMKAAAVVRGQLLGELNPGGTVPSTTPNGAVTLPKFYAVDRKVPSCFHGLSKVPASCHDSLTGDGAVGYHGPATAPAISAPVAPPPGMRCPYGLTPPCPNYVSVIYNARYPPLYYAIVGLPSLLANANWAVYLMRLLSAALSAFFLALAITSALIWSKSRLILIGILLASTPMTLYLGGVVNPSGLEIAAAMAVFVTGVILVREHLYDPPRALIVALALSATVLELVRGLSPLWLACSAVILIGLSNWNGLRSLVRRRSVHIAGLVVFAFGVFALVWIFKEHALLIEGTPLKPPQSSLVVFEHAFSHTDYYLPTMVGVFGSFDTFSPLYTYVIWYALIGFVALGALVLSKRRDMAMVIGIAVAIVIIPIAISSSQVNRYGYSWNGRDTLPLAVGLPIVAAALLGETAIRNHHARLIRVVTVLIVFAQFAAFFEMLRRYTVGTNGPDFAFLTHPSWRPPFGPIDVVIFEAIVLLIAGFVVTRVLGSRPGGDLPSGDQSSDPASDLPSELSSVLSGESESREIQPGSHAVGRG